MNGSGSSSWPTATTFSTREGWTAEEIEERQKDVRSQTLAKGKHYTGNGFGLSLGAAAAMWPTAATRDYHAQGATHNTAAQSDSLATVAEKKWPTPMAGTPAQNGNSAAGNSDFSRKAEELARGLWQTPVSDDAPDRAKGKINSRGEPKLSGQAMQWSTPRASDAEKGGPNQTFGAGGIPLPAQTAQWPTPAAQNVKRSSPDSVTRADGKTRMDILHYAAEQGFSHPAPATGPDGPTLSQLLRIWRQLRASVIASHGRGTWRRLLKSRDKRRLNQIFVEWLMGWPPGHALCDCSETEFVLWQQAMRSALSHLPTASGPWIWTPPMETAAPMQMDLFGGEA
jgi:hypothetical protein